MELWDRGGGKAGAVGWFWGNGMGCGPIWGAAPWKGDGAPWPPPPSATAMKRLWVAVLLLLCVCHVGSVAVPQTEEPPEAPPDTTTLLSRHFQTLSDFITKELPQRLRADEIQQQAKAYAERAEVQLRPLAQELRSNVLGLFSSLLDFGKTGGTEKD
ncbi:apolipoprotein A-II-like [Phasianus colchicus]|uniref:apolipoprotein A-II-like n=1 Tax=Phasianus colchicus TaxID=9054 RepID=UPI00129D8CA8|nr:apolipoprotein A-II-like [Phasianus colchicus]